MQHNSKINQVLNFKFIGVKKSGYYSKDSQINNLEFLSPKNQIIFCHQKIGEAVQNYFFFLYTDFLSADMADKNSFNKEGGRMV